MKLNKLINLKGEALRRELLKGEFSKEDKKAAFAKINSASEGGGSC